MDIVRLCCCPTPKVSQHVVGFLRIVRDFHNLKSFGYATVTKLLKVQDIQITNFGSGNLS